MKNCLFRQESRFRYSGRAWALVDLLAWIPVEVADQSRILPYLERLTQLVYPAK